MSLIQKIDKARPVGQKLNRKKTVRGCIKEQQTIFDVFEHLLRLNKFNNQVFFLNGFGHTFKNSINSILLGSTLLNLYVQDINALFDELNDEPEGVSADFIQACCSILGTMPQVIKGISNSTLKLEQSVSYLSELSGQSSASASSTVDINPLVTRCSTMIQHQIDNYTNRFRLDLKGTPAVLSGSAELLSQVILNLLMNALLSLPDRTCAVVISTSCDPATGQTLICVRDEGIGISDDYFPHIVKPFFTTWQERGCVGLGLTVADRVVRNYGGELSIDSEVGKGTNVSVMLPLCSPNKREF
jgi:signal transduction histidine kinase